MNHKAGTKFNFAIVGRSSSIEDYDMMKQKIRENSVEIIYEKTSRDKLIVTEEKIK